MRYVRWLLFSLLMSLSLGPGSLLAGDEVFDVKPVADGVYAAIAKPTFRTNCNSAFILLDDSVLVVDTESKPSAARALIAEIKRVTEKPVRYVVITHFHGDHTQGAEAYVSAWPGVEIISSEATREHIEKFGMARMKRELVTVPQQIEKFKGDLQKASDAKQKEQIQKSIAQAEAYLEEIKLVHIVLPTLTIERNLILQSKSRKVEILSLGGAHTDGDLFVYLPKEKVIITGDAIHSLTPTMRDCSPYDYIHTLDAVGKLDFDYVIAGHGDVFRGKATFELWKEYLTDLMAEAAQANAAGETLDDVRKRLVPILVAKYGPRFHERFPLTVVSNVEKAYRTVNGATE
jgi:cyclase